jgi:t-SNARE complex subunit (syntaxin)
VVELGIVLVAVHEI